MKNFTRLIFALILLLSVVQTYAQVKRIGIKSGLNLSKGTFVDPDFGNLINDDMKNKTGANVMFLWESSKNEYFLTQVGLGYTGKGFKSDSFKLRMHYIELPIIMNFRLPIAGPVKVMAGFGPYLGFAFYGKEVMGESTNQDILEYAYGKKAEYNKPYNPIDLGLVFSGNVEVALPEGKVVEVGASYELGISKISNKSTYWFDIPDVEPINPGLKTGTLSISVTYLFELKKEKSPKQKPQTQTQVQPQAQPNP